MAGQRDLNEYLRKIGVRQTDPSLPTGGLLQPVEIVLDSRQVSPPLLPNHFYAGGRQASQGANLFGILSLQAGGAGARVVQIASGEQAACVLGVSPTVASFTAKFAGLAITNAQTPIALGEPSTLPTALVNFQSNNANPFLILGPWFGVLPIAATQTILALDWWIPPGGVLWVFQNSVANAPFDAFVEWYEPKGALGPP